jgi:hypothetical protein
MHERGPALPPAGWYPDAFDSSSRRWWDGSAWTQHIRRSEPAVSVPVPLSVPGPVPVSIEPEPALTRRQLREREGGLATGAYVPGIPAVSVLERPAEISSVEYARRAAGYAPSATPAIARGVFATEPVLLGSAQTLPAWFIAVSPLWYAGIEILVTLIGRLVVPNPERPIVVPTIVILGFILIALARVDGARLRDRGYRPVNAGWALLPVVYFGMRVARTGSTSAAMLVTYVILQLLFLAVLTAVVYLLVLAVLQT